MLLPGEMGERFKAMALARGITRAAAFPDSGLQEPSPRAEPCPRCAGILDPVASRSYSPSCRASPSSCRSRARATSCSCRTCSAGTDQGLAFDVAVHVGTLFAVVTYFRRELAAMARAWFASLAGGGLTPDARLAWCVMLGTIPVGLVGLRSPAWIEEKLRNPLSVAGTLAVFGALMWLADRFGRRERDEYSRRLARRDPDRLRAGARADAGHLALGRDHDAWRARSG